MGELPKSKVPYSEEEKKDLAIKHTLFCNAYNQREEAHEEFNDMTYTMWHESNAQNANSYNPPKKNEEDTRIVTGITQEKEISLLSALLNFNFEPEQRAFDKRDMEIAEIGMHMNSMVKKSRIMEQYDEKRQLIYKEMLDQGDVFVEEVRKKQVDVSKVLNDDFDFGEVKISKIKWKEDIKSYYEKCEVNIISGLSVFEGNFKNFFIQEQPYIFTTDLIPASVGKALFRNWDRLEYVSDTVTEFSTENSTTDIEFHDFSFQKTLPGFWEVTKFYDRWNNEFQLYLNGVQMLPVGFPLTVISPSGLYPIAKGSAEPISKFFSRSKSIASKTKVDQAVVDEMLRLMLLKTKKSYMPSYTYSGNKVLSRKIFLPAQITKDIKQGELNELGNNTGVNQAEFNMYSMMRRMIDEKSVSPNFAGNAGEGSQTATEVIELKKQQMNKLGSTIVGVTSLERQLVDLRRANILATWTKKVDDRIDETKEHLEELYRSVTTEEQLSDGRKGLKIIEFSKSKTKPVAEGGMTPDQVKAEESLLSEYYSKPVKKVYLNPDLMRKLEATWYTVIVPTEKDSSSLDRIMFMKDIQTGAEVFGPMAYNMAYLKERFASIIGENPKMLFTAQQASPASAQGEEGKSPMDAIMSGLMPKVSTQPQQVKV